MNATTQPLRFWPQALTGAWVGFAGGILFGIFEAWSILVQHATDPIRALIGLAAAAGFVVALDGLLGAISFGLISTMVAWLIRNRPVSAQSWVAFCVGFFTFLLLFVVGLEQFGVFAGSVRGARMILGAGLVFVGSLLIGAVAFYLARQQQGIGQRLLASWGRRLLVIVWLAAVALPVAYALAGR